MLTSTKYIKTFSTREDFFNMKISFHKCPFAPKTEIKNNHQSWKHKHGGIKESLYFNAKVLMEVFFSSAALPIPFPRFPFLALSFVIN